MRSFSKHFGLIALLAIMALLSGCVTTSIGGTIEPHGLISNGGVIRKDATPIASFSVILGLVTIGYPEYAAQVLAADAAGRKISSVSTNYFGFFGKTTAYVR